MPLDENDIKLINGILTGRDEALMKKFGESIDSAIKAQKAADDASRRQADEEVRKAQEKAQKDKDDAEAKKKANEGKSPEAIKLSEQEAELAALKAQLLKDKTESARAQLELRAAEAAKGKLAPNAEKLILREFLSFAEMGEDFKFTFKIGNQAIPDVSQALDQWLSLPDNKGYVRPPSGLNSGREAPKIVGNENFSSPPTSLVSALSEIDL